MSSRENVEKLAGMVIFAWYAIAVYIVVMWMLAVLGLYPKHDATDPTWGHSGLELLTDYGTGCQYVARPGAGMMVRLRSDGRPFCGAQ